MNAKIVILCNYIPKENDASTRAMISRTIFYKMKNYDGIVVTMGTDTLQFADTAISFLIQQNNIPIVFTGSKVNSEQIHTDARSNFREAISVAGETDLAETVTVFNHQIIRAVKTKKINASEYNAFTSSDGKTFGKIEEFITFNQPYKKKNKKKPILFKKLEERVSLVKVYPGFNGNRIKHLVDQGVKGIVLEGFGLGNLPLLDGSIKDGIAYADKKNTIIVVTSDSFLGDYWQQIYDSEIGTRLKEMKIIPVYDMLSEVAYIKLMWVLAQTSVYTQVKKMMQTNYVGEITMLKNGSKKQK
ncbi:asparaginase [archaeon]|nr:asparaginase [archaeon]